MNYDFNSFVRKEWIIFLLSCIIGILSHPLVDYLFESGLLFSESHKKSAERIFAVTGFLLILIFFLSYKKEELNILSEVDVKEKIIFWSFFLFFILIFSFVKIIIERKGISFAYITVVLINSGLLSILLLSLLYKSCSPTKSDSNYNS
jgi:hypothetical protein